MASDPNWHLRAVCRGLNTNLFFPEKGDYHTTKTAVAYCNGGTFDVLDEKGKPIGRDTFPPCPVRIDCLEWALRFPADQDAYGIYGGMNPNQRDKIRTERRLAGQGVTVRFGASQRGREPQHPISS